jgi:hypothetical protein
MVTNSFENQKYMQPMGTLKQALKVPWFFSFKFTNDIDDPKI